METLLHRFNGEYLGHMYVEYKPRFSLQQFKLRHRSKADAMLYNKVNKVPFSQSIFNPPLLWFHVRAHFSAEPGASILADSVPHVPVDAGVLHQTS